MSLLALKTRQNCRMRGLLIALAWLAVAMPAWAAHAYSQWGEVRYPAGFSHFEYVNSQAPKGGEMVIVSNQRVSNFDKYNPFSLRGSAPAYMAVLIFESLLTGSADENGTGYGLLASDVQVPGLAGANLTLSPVQAAGSDPVVKQTTWTDGTGTATVPPRTVAVLVQH